MLGIQYNDTYPVEETFQLLKVQWEWYVAGKSYDVVIARKKDLPDYDGPVIDITDNDIFQNVRNLLNNGQQHLHEPLCDIALDALRKELKKYTTIIEIPPSPWIFSYVVALTHDVDVTSVRHCCLRSAVVAACRCIFQFHIEAGGKILLAKFGLAKDPWDLFDRWKKIETEMNVRSTFYFVPQKNTAGISSHPYRVVHYDIDLTLISNLISEGWETGVHGIDNWVNSDRGKEELQALHMEHGGNRTHWLLFDQKSWLTLDTAGYSYDSTFGYNEDIGFRAGTMQVYRPEGVSNVLELPLHIQDVALFGKFCWAPTDKGWVKTPCLNLSDPAAMEYCDRIFDHAKNYGGVITVLWHYENLTPPHDWSMMYSSLVSRVQHDHAWVTTAMKVVSWFRARRKTKIECCVHNKRIIIHIDDCDFDQTPSLKIRVHVDPSSISNIDGEFILGDHYVDIRCDRPIINVVLR
jgi:hypothetical protein